jgi:hypothetical protein
MREAAVAVPVLCEKRTMGHSVRLAASAGHEGPGPNAPRTPALTRVIHRLRNSRFFVRRSR